MRKKRQTSEELAKKRVELRNSFKKEAPLFALLALMPSVAASLEGTQLEHNAFGGLFFSLAICLGFGLTMLFLFGTGKRANPKLIGASLWGARLMFFSFFFVGLARDHLQMALLSAAILFLLASDLKEACEKLVSSARRRNKKKAKNKTSQKEVEAQNHV